MMHEDALAGTKFSNAGTDFFYYADRLMAEHQRRFAPDVPRHDVAGADAAGAHPHQHIGGAHLGAGTLFDPNVAEIVESRYLHCHPRTLWCKAPVVNSRGVVRKQPRNADAGRALPRSNEPC
jgi:hypothetical protein